MLSAEKGIVSSTGHGARTGEKSSCESWLVLELADGRSRNSEDQEAWHTFGNLGILALPPATYLTPPPPDSPTSTHTYPMRAGSTLLSQQVSYPLSSLVFSKVFLLSLSDEGRAWFQVLFKNQRLC